MKKLMLAGLIVLSAVSFARHGGSNGGNGGCNGDECAEAIMKTVDYKVEVYRPLMAKFAYGRDTVDFGCIIAGDSDRIMTYSQDAAKLNVKGDRYRHVKVEFDNELTDGGVTVTPSAKVTRNGSYGSGKYLDGSGHDSDFKLYQYAGNGYGGETIYFGGKVDVDDYATSKHYTLPLDVTLSYK